MQSFIGTAFVIAIGLYLIPAFYLNLQIARTVLPVARQTGNLVSVDRMTVLLLALHITESMCLKQQKAFFFHAVMLCVLCFVQDSWFLTLAFLFVTMGRCFMMWISFNHLEIVFSQIRSLPEIESNGIWATSLSQNHAEIW